MNLPMTVWMKQDAILRTVAAAQGSPHQMMVVPSTEVGDFVAADRANSLLPHPQVAQLPPLPQVTLHLHA